jgi:hypothetical protein
MCLEWFQEVQQQARGEADAAAGRALCVLEYSILFDDWLAIWVLSGAGELLGSAKVPTAAYRLDTVGRFVFDDGLTRRNPQSGAHRLKGKIRGNLHPWFCHAPSSFPRSLPTKAQGARSRGWA